MSFLAPMTNSNQGAGFQGQGADIVSPASKGQADQMYRQSQLALQGSRDITNQLWAQNGMANQSNVFQQQQQLANQLLAQTQGGGPNPAQAALAQNTAANTANQAALMASQRGTSANPGMIARQAAQQGAANQQNAIGQAATLQAQQQLAAQQQLMGQQQAMQGVAGTQVGQLQNAIGAENQFTQNEQQNILNAIAQTNNANIGMQSNINNVNAGIAQGNQGFQQGLVKGVGGSILPAMSVLAMSDGGQVPGYAAGGDVNQYGPQSNFGKALLNPNNQGGPNQVSVEPTHMSGSQDNSAFTNNNQLADLLKSFQGTSGSPGALPGATGESTATAGGAADMGEMAMLAAADGGQIDAPGTVGGSSDYHTQLANLKEGAEKSKVNPNKSTDVKLIGGYNIHYDPRQPETSYAKGGRVDVLVSPGEKLYSPGGKVSKVDGKAKVAGDSYQNDTVHKKLKPGTIVVPRTAAKDPEKSKQFIAAILARKGMK